MLTGNQIKIVGTLTDVTTKTGVIKSNGHNYISATATIKSMLEGRENTFEVHFFASDVTSKGEHSKLFDIYSNLDRDFKGKKVELSSASLRENRRVGSDGNLRSFQEIDGRFIKVVPSTTEDIAQFHIEGFVVTGMTEKTNKEGKVYRYDVSIGQANYRGDNMSLFTLHIDPNDSIVMNGMKEVKVGETREFDGNLRFFVSQVVAESKVTGFGTGNVKTFTNKQSNYWICGASAAITEAADTYSNEIISTLISSYKASGVEIQQKDTKTSAPAAVESAEPAKPSMRQASLI